MALNSNSVVVITGAASGIGRALAVRLAAEKIKGFAISDMNEAGLAETAAMLENSGVPISTHILDVSKIDQWQQFFDQVTSKHGRVTHLINNAGVALVGYFEDVSLEDMQWLMNINFWGTVNGTTVFLPAMREHDEGHIVNVSSVFGFIAPPGQTAYVASKFAVRGFTESLRHELEGTNITISTVHPGGVKTNICNDSRVGSHATDKDKAQVVKFFDKASPTTAEQAAEIIVNGIKKKEVRIVVGQDAKRIDKIQRLFPKTYYSVMDRLTGGKLKGMMRKK